MSVALRLARTGMKGTPQYRIVTSKKGSKRDGSFIEVVGTYNPALNPPEIKVKEERVKYWISVGAKPTKTVKDIIRKVIPNYLETLSTRQKEKIVAKRRARKIRTKNRLNAK